MVKVKAFQRGNELKIADNKLKMSIYLVTLI